MNNTSFDYAVGLSGGVDSSVAAALLKQQGAHIFGVFMQNWEDDNDDDYCSIKEDSRDAIAVADILGLDIELVNFAKEYKDQVFAYFLAEYRAGRTPNPDVLCNAEIKFKSFLDYAISMGAPKIATGHYAATGVDRDGMTTLLRGLDESKDQSYFLYRLTQYQISRAVFPLGRLQKSEVRKMALDLGLPNHAKKDSTGICFIGERPFREFLNRYLPRDPGLMKDENGRPVGEHMGLMYYTIGQRKGLAIGGEGDAWYVAGKNLEANELVVAGVRFNLFAQRFDIDQRHRHDDAGNNRSRDDDLSQERRDGPKQHNSGLSQTAFGNQTNVCINRFDAHPRTPGGWRRCWRLRPVQCFG